MLAPALAAVAKRGIVFAEPPQVPQGLGLAALGVDPCAALWLKTPRTSEALWAAEQVLKSGACGALLLWQNQIRTDSLRRLTLAAQTGETLFFMMRPLIAAQDPSPAALRLALRPRAGGIEIEFVKRRVPARDERLFLPMSVGAALRIKPREHFYPEYQVSQPTVERSGAAPMTTAR